MRALVALASRGMRVGDMLPRAGSGTCGVVDPDSRPATISIDQYPLVATSTRHLLVTGTSTGPDRGDLGMEQTTDPARPGGTDTGTGRSANAVYHATGRRIRSLPITIHQLL
jgi:hypothetical protein